MLPLWDLQPHKRTPVVVTALIAANLGAFGYEAVLLVEGKGGLESMVWANSLVPARLLRGWTDERQWLTLLSHMFLHGGVAHLLGNLWFLWVFGNNVEDRIGPFRFLGFYFVCGLGAAVLQVLVGPGATVPMLGASGAISGVLGAYFVLYPFAWIVALVPWIVPIVPVPAFIFLILWFGFQAVNGFGALMGGTQSGGGVAWWAHAGGFLSGVALTLWAKNKGWIRRAR